MQIIDDEGQVNKLNKSTLCWILQDKSRLTNDRLKRFIYGKSAAKTSILQQIEAPISQNDFISKGDYVVLLDDSNFWLLQVLNFQILDQKTLKGKRYNKSICSLVSNNSEKVGFSGNLFLITSESKIIHKNISKYISVQNYVCHVKKNMFNLNTCEISPEILNYCESLIEIVEK